MPVEAPVCALPSLSLLLVALDQASKHTCWWGAQTTSTFGGTFRSVWSRTGRGVQLFASAGSMFRDLVAIAPFFARRPRALSLMLLASALGALSAPGSRIRYGYVVDFIYSSFWPTFNVADIAITLGAGLLAYCLLVSPDPTRTESS